jgi:hypothetical protein
LIRALGALALGGGLSTGLAATYPGAIPASFTVGDQGKASYTIPIVGYARDGEAAAVNYASTDRFRLDGQRLVSVAGNYGAHNTEYRTELEAFQRVSKQNSPTLRPWPGKCRSCRQTLHGTS